MYVITKGIIASNLNVRICQNWIFLKEISRKIKQHAKYSNNGLIHKLVGFLFSWQEYLGN